MRFRIERTLAQVLLAQAIKTSNTKQKDKPDSRFYIEHVGGDIFITSTCDLSEQTIKIPTSNLLVDPSEPQAFTIDAVEMSDAVKLFPNGEVGVIYSPDEKSVYIGAVTGKTRVRFGAGLADEFAKMNFSKKGSPILVSAPALLTVLKSTASCASTDPTRTPLTAVRLQIGDTAVVSAASDEARIAYRQVATPQSAGDGVGNPPSSDTSAEFLIPKESAEGLCALLETVGDTEVSLQPGSRQIRLEWGNTVYTTMLEHTGRSFPDMTMFLDGNEVARATISRADLARSIKISALVAKDSTITVAIDDDKKTVTLSTDEAAKGATQDPLNAQDAKGNGETEVQCKLFQKAVDGAQTPWVELILRTMVKDKVALVVAEQVGDDDDAQHLIFPSRRKDISPRPPATADSSENDAPDDDSDIAEGDDGSGDD